MKKILIVFLLTVTLVGCTNKEKANFETTETEQYAKIMQEGNYIIIDVRTKEEYDEGHIKDAINIPYDEIDENTNLDKDKTIFVYCRSGARSSNAYNTLKNLGYTVYDLGALSSIDLPKE